jgi:hypothetical protein
MERNLLVVQAAAKVYFTLTGINGKVLLLLTMSTMVVKTSQTINNKLYMAMGWALQTE